MTGRRTPAAMITLLLGGVLGPPSFGAPTIHQVARDSVTLTVRLLTARALREPEGGWVMELEDPSAAELEMLLEWPTPGATSRLRLRAVRGLNPAGHVARLEAELAGTDGSNPVRATREILVGPDATTALFEVARAGGDRVLTLVVEAELTRTTAFTALPVAGAPLEFQLEIEWIENGQPVRLETNLLHTFVGEPVSYSFRLGEPGQAESVRLELRPVQVIGETARIEVELSGTLPDAEGRVTLVSRKEQWLSTSGTTSALSLATGEPAVGFRFLVTPRF